MAATTSKAGYRSGRDLPAVAENIELLTGQRGNKLDKAITYRELADIGLITLRKAANNALSPSVAPGVLPDESIERPVAPTGVIANGAFHTILVEWDLPAYKGHAHAEVWRAEEDNRAKAVKVGTSAANMYSDAIGKGASVYYWVRFVNRSDIQGPFHGVTGVHAVTSRDVQDILDELEGKIGASHLVQELLTPIQSVPQIKIDLSDLDDALVRTDAALKALDAREAQVNDLLNSAQSQLGSNYLSVTVIQETLRQKIDRYQGDFNNFRDAVFSTDPSTGEITMEAVNAVRSELGAQISVVSQHLDAVESIVNTCVTRAEIQGDLERITNVEQQIDGINATLTQTATKSEVSAVSSTVTQVSQSLDATNATLAQKAAQTTVTAQGERLAAAEQQISANTTATTANAQRIEQVKAALDQADSSISAGITELQQAMVAADQAMASRLTNLEATTGTQSAQISELQQAVTGDGQSLAGRFESIQASIDLSAKAAMGGVLASAEADRQSRKAEGSIKRDQEVIVTEQKAQAQVIEDMRTSFEAELSETDARITSVQTTLSDADKAMAERVDAVESAYKAADQQTAASISSLQQTMTSADSALAQSISRIESEYKAADSATSSAISALQKVVSDGDSALSQQIGVIDAAYKNADSSLQGKIAQEGTTRATVDAALGEQINTVAAKANNTEAAVQTHSQAIASLENGAQAMWTAKANAGGITAGIGLIAKSDGTSQVAISASQVFVFNPNSPNALSPLFAIDNGQVIMAEAIIRTATIQILNSQQITADYVKAGVSLSAPVINGGSIVIGSNFTVTASGAMTAWSATLRYVTSYYGTINYATIQNCTITEDCDVKGTIYAAKIVGDVVCSGIKAINSDTFYESIGVYTLATATVPGGRSHDCHLFCDGLLVIAESSGSQSTNGDVLYRGAISGELRVMSGSSKLASFPFMVSAMSGRVGSFMNEAVMAIGGVYVGRGEGTITVELAITSRTAEGDATNKATARVRVPAQSSKFSLIPKGSLLSIS